MKVTRRALTLSTSSLLLAACGQPPPVTSGGGAVTASRGSTSTGALVKDFKDFKLVAYQGEQTLGGRETTFATLFAQRKPVVLNFWAGLCPPCRAEMPAFQRVADAFASKVILFGLDVGVFTGLGNQDEARALLRELAIRYPAGYAVDAAPLRLYNVRSMPSTVFLTPNGHVTEVAGGLLVEQQLRQKIEQLLAAT